ncbi:General transcription factor II-I repeat domain-containing protein 2 [Cucumispora dikerogammari]|nr:General transcription factor II-I repeat domain-containing protein 2 [Cucumispora dikerogammari]
MGVFKEYNLKRHYLTRPLFFGNNLTKDEKTRKIQQLVGKLKKMQSFFPNRFTLQYAVSEVDLVLSYMIVKRNKTFSNGEFIKACLSHAADIICPEQKQKIESIALSRKTVVKRINQLSENLINQLRDVRKEFLCYSLTLNESTDFQNTAQLLIFIRGINGRFEITEELLA